MLNDATIIGAILNIINTITNLYWSNKLRGVQVNKELMADLRDSNEEKEAVIRQLHTKKNEYKNQFLHLLVEYKRLQGELSVYKKSSIQSPKP